MRLFQRGQYLGKQNRGWSVPPAAAGAACPVLGTCQASDTAGL